MEIYKVKKGDTLWKIAKEIYGDGKKWWPLYKNNVDVIGGNPHLIKEGQELKIW